MRTALRTGTGLLFGAIALLATGDRGMADPGATTPIDLTALVETFAPKGWELASAVYAHGIETYAPAGGTWSSKGASADLFALDVGMVPKTERVGSLSLGYQGLTWDFGYGRRVVETAEGIEGAGPKDLEWARITVRHFSDVNSTGGWSYILQVHTTGGRAPSAPPAATDTDWVGVPFSAYYVFLKPKR